MIIKSISHKRTNIFGALVKYIHKGIGEENPMSYTHQMDADGFDQPSIRAAFEMNAEHRRKRKNGVTLYHELIAFSPKDRPALEANPQYLPMITQHYLNLRAPSSPAAATTHWDTKHVHIHMLISGNQRASQMPSRISKADLQKVKKQMREYMLLHCPELQHSYTKERQRKKDKERVQVQKQQNQAKKAQAKKSQKKQKKSFDDWWNEPYKPMPFHKRKPRWSKTFTELEAFVWASFFRNDLGQFTRNLEKGPYELYYSEKGYLKGFIVGDRKYSLWGIAKKSPRVKERMDEIFWQLKMRVDQWKHPGKHAERKFERQLDWGMSTLFHL